MQIPQNVINMLSAKGKGYVEAALKIAQGQKLIEEGTLEIAALDGKQLKTKAHLHAGGVDVMATVRDLTKPKDMAAVIRAQLQDGPKSTVALAAAIGRSVKRTRVLVERMIDVTNVGSGKRMRWALGTLVATSQLTKRSTLLNKTTRRPSPKAASPRRSKTAAQNIDLRRPNTKAEAANQALVLKALETTPGQTIGPLMRATKRSFYPVVRAIMALVKAGKLRKVVTPDKHNRAQTSWEIVRGA